MAPKTRAFYELDFSKPTRKHFKVCQKIKAIKMVKRMGFSVSYVAKRYNVTRSVIYGWLSKATELMSVGNKFVRSSCYRV